MRRRSDPAPRPRSDDTVILRPAAPVRPASRRGPIAAGTAAAGVVLLLAAAGWFWLAQPGAPVTVPVPVPAPVAVPPAPAVVAPSAEVPVEAIPLAEEAAIRDESPAVRTVLRFADNPAVVVIDFPTLAEQGRMLNRLAAWAEKAGVPHDRVPDEATVAAAIAASGATADTYYYGHDYSGAAVERFFADAARQGLALRPDEEALRRIAARAAAEPAGLGAIISVVRADAANGVSAQARATILHHELSHGEYFTDPAYAAYVAQFWQTALTAPEREAVRGYLQREGYDPALEDLMRNEMQAYLMHTPDPAFFEAERAGLTPARLAVLRQMFLAGMPPGWLRDALAASGTVPASLPPVQAPAQAPGRAAPVRRPCRVRQVAGSQRAARVSMGRAVTATVPPRRRRASAAV